MGVEEHCLGFHYIFNCRALSMSHLHAESSAQFSPVVMVVVEWPATKVEVASANSTVVTPWRDVGRLFTNILENRRGSRTDPCGTPEVTVRSSECSKSTVVH